MIQLILIFLYIFSTKSTAEEPVLSIYDILDFDTLPFKRATDFTLDILDKTIGAFEGDYNLAEEHENTIDAHIVSLKQHEKTMASIKKGLNTFADSCSIIVEGISVCDDIEIILFDFAADVQLFNEHNKDEDAELKLSEMLVDLNHIHEQCTRTNKTSVILNDLVTSAFFASEVLVDHVKNVQAYIYKKLDFLSFSENFFNESAAELTSLSVQKITQLSTTVHSYIPIISLCQEKIFNLTQV